MDAADAISYLDSAIARGARAEKYYVDLSGSGEPLLNLPAVLRISQWCKKKSDELRREVLPRLVTNGLLLSPKIAKALQSNGILFGVSLDGDRAIHNKHRIDMGGNATFDIVLDNVSKIESREYIGCAVTITKDVFPLFEALESLLPYFRTISVRPVRGPFGLDEKSLRDWLHEYDEMAMRICERMKTGDIALLLALLNGEDYLGTFLSNMLVRKKRLTRCDAYISRFAISIEGEVSGCPSENGSRPPIKPEERLERAVMECAGCDFKYFCGGVCPIEKDEEALRIECEFQKHLVLLSAYILDEAMHYPGEFRRLRDLSYQKLERNRLDTELDDFLNRHKEYTFTEGKKVFDALKRRY